ncbi:hypothetical protein HWV62_9171 [Athelia sp. TMB]|nr:hypothetical protein HWV62_9171 [Athelia sp. TMB]
MACIPDVFGVAPKLRSVEICTIYGMYKLEDYKLPWNQLNSALITAMHADVLFVILDQLENIAELNVGVFAFDAFLGSGMPVELSPRGAHVTLALLTSLRLNNEFTYPALLESLFDNFTFPSLTLFEFRGDLHPEDGHTKLASMLQRSSTRNPLTHLVLRIRSTVPEIDNLSQILQATPHVVDPTLRGQLEDGYLTIGDKALRALTVTDSSCLVPELRTFTYGPQDSPYLGNGEALVEMMESRRGTNGWGATKKLQSLRVDSPSFITRRVIESLTEPALNTLRNYLAEGIFSITGIESPDEMVASG